MGSPPVRKKTTFYLTLHSYTLILSYLQTLCIHGIACVQCAWPYLNGQDPTLRITGFENLVRIPPSELREVVYLGLATTFFVVVVVIWSSKTPCVRAHGLPSIGYRSYHVGIIHHMDMQQGEWIPCAVVRVGCAPPVYIPLLCCNKTISHMYENS